MASFERGVICYITGAKFNNGCLVELVQYLGAQVGQYFSVDHIDWWEVRSRSPLYSDFPLPIKITPPGTRLALRQIHLRPISGPSLGITEEDVKELYEPARLSQPLPANPKRVLPTRNHQKG